jgi:hypothetical protein
VLLGRFSVEPFSFLTLMTTSRRLSTGGLGLNLDLDICGVSNSILKVGDASAFTRGCNRRSALCGEEQLQFQLFLTAV